MITSSIELNKLLNEKFPNDHLVTLATSNENIPNARHVNIIYNDLNLYFVTEFTSKKITEIQNNPIVAIVGDWFIAHGIATIEGPLMLGQNKKIFELLKMKLGPWFNSSKINFNDKNIIIVSVKLNYGNFKLNAESYEFDLRD